MDKTIPMAIIHLLRSFFNKEIFYHDLFYITFKFIFLQKYVQGKNQMAAIIQVTTLPIAILPIQAQQTKIREIIIVTILPTIILLATILLRAQEAIEIVTIVIILLTIIMVMILPAYKEEY